MARTGTMKRLLRTMTAATLAIAVLLGHGQSQAQTATDVAGPAEPVVAFTDISGSPYAAAIRDLTGAGVIGGYPDGTFRPDAPVLRAQFAKMTVLTLRLPLVESLMQCPFPDVESTPDSLYPDDVITTAVINQIASGYADGLFRPYTEVSRAQVLTMVVRGLRGSWPELLPEPTSATESPWGAFDPTHAAAAALAAKMGLLAGLPAASLDPWAPMPRGEVAQVLANLPDLTANRTLESRFRTTLDPFYNRYYQPGSPCPVAIREIAPEVATRVFPATVPAYDAAPRPLPPTDLTFHGEGPGGFLPTPTWHDPVAESLVNQRGDFGNPDPPPLHDDVVARTQAAAFLAEHGLTQPDLRLREVVWGSRVAGPTETRILEWIVRYDQTTLLTADGTLPTGLSLRVGPTDRVMKVSWDLVDLVVDGQVRVRPLADLLADPQAWLNGSLIWDRTPGVQSPAEVDTHDAPLRVDVVGVQLDYERIFRYAEGDAEAQRLAPVYSFRVRVLEPAASAGVTGVWKVTAAADARRD